MGGFKAAGFGASDFCVLVLRGPGFGFPAFHGPGMQSCFERRERMHVNQDHISRL